MTICISVICMENAKQNLVFTVDYMITIGIGQFEWYVENNMKN